MTSARRDLIRAVETGLRDVANPEAGPGVQAYLKSTMPCRGVTAPKMRAVFKDALTRHPIDERDVWEATVLALWREAKFREERYVAIELAGARSANDFRDFSSLTLFEEMIVTGAWWDLVDPIATHRLRELLVRYPKGMTRRMRAWSHAGDKWKRRSAILCQLGRKAEIDLDLLWHCLDENLSHPDFFVRKAIGWALRDLAWYDLATVEEYVARNAERMSGLSRREALKNAAKIRSRR